MNKKGKVHVIINYLDFCNDELVTVISDEDLLTLSRMLAYEIDKRYGINFDSIDIKQMKGEIALHMYGYIWFGLKIVMILILTSIAMVRFETQGGV